MSNENEQTIIKKEAEFKKTRSFSFNKIIIILGIMGLIAIFLAGFATFCYFKKSFTTLALTVDNLQMTQKKYPAEDLQKNLNLVLQSIPPLQDDVKQIQQTIHDFSQTQRDDNDILQISEAHHYVTLANMEVQYANNIPLAITLLKLADEKIHALAQTKFDTLRRALANDIATLQATPQVDTTGLYMRLMALNNQIDQLPLPNKIVNDALPTENVSDNKENVWWKRGWNATWQALQKIVVVRYNKNGQLPLVTPEQQVFLYQNLHAILAQSIWGLLHQNPSVYQTSLQQMTVWVKQYFVPESSVTRAVMVELNQLQTIDIHSNKPEITSLELFDNIG